MPLTPLIWPEQPIKFNGAGLALALLSLPMGTLRPDARRHARQVLRKVLGNLLTLPPEEVTLYEGPHGPVLNSTASDIRISLSYAGEWVLIGLAEGRALGVDIVRVDSFPEIEALCQIYLPEAASRAVFNVPVEARDAAFALGWARMEACSKCLGLPLAEIGSERAQALAACDFVDCGQVGGYQMAVAVLPRPDKLVSLYDCR